MSAAGARSVFAFGAYMLAQGAVLGLAPSLLLSPFGVAADSPWIRVVGWCLAVLGLYYVQASREGRVSFFALSAKVRLAQLAFFAAMVGSGLLPAVVLLFALVEAASGVWTLLELRGAPPARGPASS